MTMDNKTDLQPLAIVLRDVVNLYASESLVRDCIAAGWLNPIVQRGRLCLFERERVYQVWDKILGGELPPRRKQTEAQ